MLTCPGKWLGDCRMCPWPTVEGESWLPVSSDFHTHGGMFIPTHVHALTHIHTYTHNRKDVPCYERSMAQSRKILHKHKDSVLIPKTHIKTSGVLFCTSNPHAGEAEADSWLSVVSQCSQRVKTPSIKADNLGLIPRIHIVARFRPVGPCLKQTKRIVFWGLTLEVDLTYLVILTEHTCTHPNTHRIMASRREAGYSHSGGETLFIHLNHSMFVEHSHMVLDTEEDKV